MRTVTSTLGSVRRLAIIGASLALAACGSSQNWHDSSPYVTIGGTVDGFTGGTLAVWNNGGDKLAIAANGPFSFPLQIANGSDYSVVVATQPEGQDCKVTNGSGTANGNVKNVTVACKPYVFKRRLLSDIPGDPYSTGNAVNYSGYRTADGPKAQEVPSDTEILQDLTLLHTAGFKLLRLFGAEAPATDVVAEKVLRIANQYYPDMKFQLGVALGGLTSCSDTKNDYNIAYLISHLSKYPNVVTISVGNETSFYSKYMPLPCLEGYIRTIRSQVTQPVTADDDFSFYAGKSQGGGDRVTVKPDTILALIDFASIHMYPISYTTWTAPACGPVPSSTCWQQTGVAAGLDRAKAMMEASLATAKTWFNQVATYPYVGAGGVTVTVGASMPIVIGETGWKATPTNHASEIEYYAANEVNAKWYYDLLYGTPDKNYDDAWQRSEGGPSAIFYFEAFDETWKGSDDGWGLWDIDRTPRYVFCGTSDGPDCNAELYEGAGYYDPPPFSTITFDSPDVYYTFIGFAGAEDSQRVADPAGGTDLVARVKRSKGSLVYAGTVVGTVGPTVGIVPISATDTRMTVQVYSPKAGIPVRLKLVRSQDNPDDPNNKNTVETEVRTTVANKWEELTFDFATPVPGTPALNTSLQYNQLAVFFDFGKTGAEAGDETFYFDDVKFIGGGGLPTESFSDISFDAAGVTYTLTGFGGADGTVVPDLTDASNLVAKVVKSGTAQSWAGTTVSTEANNSVGTIPFTTTNTKMTVRVYSPDKDIPVRLKVEDRADPPHSVEAEVRTTIANGWETLTFDFANPAAGSPALNLAYDYDKVSIFFNFGTTGAQAGAKTYYFDDVVFVAGGGGGGGSGSTGTCTGAACIDFSEAGIGFVPFQNGGGGTVAIIDDPNDAANKVVEFVKKPGDGDYFGTTITGLGGSVVLTATEKTVTMRVFSPVAGTNFLLKFEGGTGGPATTEKDAATTKAGEWETLSFVMPDAGTYTTVVLFPNGRSSVTADKTMLVDELRFPAFSTGGGGGGGFVNGVYADDYVGDLPSTAKSTQGGNVGFVFDPRLAVPAGAEYDYAGVSGTAQNPGGVPNFYYGLGLKAPPVITDAFFLAYLKAPGNGTVDVSGYTNILVNVWGPDQLFKAGTFPALDVILQGPAVAGCGSPPSGGSEVQVTFNTTGQGADKVYTLPLSSFTLTTACSGETTAAQVLANIAQVKIRLKNANIQYVNKDGNGVGYTNGLNVGSIKFN